MIPLSKLFTYFRIEFTGQEQEKSPSITYEPIHTLIHTGLWYLCLCTLYVFGIHVPMPIFTFVILNLSLQ